MPLVYSILILLALLYFCLQFIPSSSNLYYSLWTREHNKIHTKLVVINKTFKMQQNYIKCMIILIVTQTAVAIAKIYAKLQSQIGRIQQMDNLEIYLLVVIFTNINKTGH